MQIKRVTCLHNGNIHHRCRHSRSHIDAELGGKNTFDHKISAIQRFLSQKKYRRRRVFFSAPSVSIALQHNHSRIRRFAITGFVDSDDAVFQFLASRLKRFLYSHNLNKLRPLRLRSGQACRLQSTAQYSYLFICSARDTGVYEARTWLFLKPSNKKAANTAIINATTNTIALFFAVPLAIG